MNTENTDEIRRFRRDENPLTESIIGCGYRVHNTLGTGFLEKVYENALVHELRKNQHHVNQQCPITVWYDGIAVGDYVADLIVDHQVLIELKAVTTLERVHIAQCLNYMRASNMRVGLLLNFSPSRLQIKRLLL